MGSHLYEYASGNWQKFTVPADVQIITITLKGAGASGNAAGGVSGKVAVNPGDVFWVKCGQDGRPASGAGTRTGGNAAEGGGGPGGDGTGTGHGGDGGGGCTQVRKNTTEGLLLAVAAGAGGDSGGNGDGGKGGAVVGGPGEKGTGTAGGASATGGTQNQVGQGGTSPLGEAFWGGDGINGKLGRGGAGGQRNTGVNVQGGGGGGGGFYPGGGGQAGRVGSYASWGGAGGSNFHGGLYDVTSIRGVGTLGHGEVLIQWGDPLPPTPPVDITINGVAIADGLATKITDSTALLRGIPNDPDHDLGYRMLVAMSGTSSFAEYKVFHGTYDPGEHRDKVLLTGLVQDKRYWLRLFSQDTLGHVSINYRSTNFWTNRRPNPPIPVEPVDNVEITPLLNVTFSWTPSDPDPSDPQTMFVIRYRAAGTPAVPAGDWITLPVVVSATASYVISAGSFKGNTFYEWQVRTRDAGAWGDFSEVQSFYCVASTMPPILLDPIHDSAVPVNIGADFGTGTFQVNDVGLARIALSGQPIGTYAIDWDNGGAAENYVWSGLAWSPFAPEVDYGDGGGTASIDITGPGVYHATGTFTWPNALNSPVFVLDVNNGVPLPTTYDFRWKFRSPTGEVQTKADFRYRAFGSGASWTVIAGDTTTPGAPPVWSIDTSIFEPGFRYEWEVETYVTAAGVSDWSDPATFWAVSAPGSGAGLNLIDSGRSAAPLSQGNNRVFVYERGGRRLLGEITKMTVVRWNRQRDDISGCTIRLTQFDEDSAALLRNLRTWMHELVVFRDNGEEVQRVWEGPVTRISGSRDMLEIEAKDVMAYVYRRIMRQGYNDSYRIINGTQVGLKTVVQRSAQIIMNSLAYDDPNVLAYLTPLHDPFDARTSRVVKDYTKTAWEEVDDLAAHAGLDYVTSGRRIILWDTHRPIGRLPEMRDGAFSEVPIVTEYGMSAANIFAVTNNNGIYGGAALGFSGLNPDGSLIIPPQGFIEQLASSYGEEASGGTTDVLTRKMKEALEANLRAQARRNIAGRWPPPVVVRIPDNAALMPDLNITINQLIPGVWIPLRASGGIREVSQWQKLDLMTCEQTEAGEKVTVTMSPAPQGGNDPDADEAAVEEA